jgi:hypothetical protein
MWAYFIHAIKSYEVYLSLFLFYAFVFMQPDVCHLVIIPKGVFTQEQLSTAIQINFNATVVALGIYNRTALFAPVQ